MSATLHPLELLHFYADCGVDEVVGDVAVNRLQVLETPPVLALPKAEAAAAPVTGTIEALGDAEALAAAAPDLASLRAALEGFEGLTIKRTATQIVFAEGNEKARVMIIGETPGSDEDRAGRPFAGPAGALLDKMFAAIGLGRENDLYITNVLNWRPPGNRAPSEAEIALSLPFLRRHIALVNPALLVLTGGGAAKALLATTQSVNRLRGRWLEYGEIPAMVLYHPAYLLQSPAQKGLAWQDLLMLKAKMAELGLIL